MAERQQASRELASLAAQACEDLKGKETVVLDLIPVTPIADFFVVTTATSARQMRAIAEEVELLMKKHGSRPRVGVEGRASETWILQDYGDIVLHVFSTEGRALYCRVLRNSWRICNRRALYSAEKHIARERGRNYCRRP